MAMIRALPRLWLFTDERQGDALWRALDRLPAGAGIVFRHRSLPAKERRVLFARVRAIASRRRLVLLLAGTAAEAHAWRADGVHGREQRGHRGLISTRAVHGVSDLAAARRARVSLVFVSPVWRTRSHPDAPILGLVRFALLAQRSHMPAVALGGVTRLRSRALPPVAHGWAAIDAWSA